MRVRERSLAAITVQAKTNIPVIIPVCILHILSAYLSFVSSSQLLPGYPQRSGIAKRLKAISIVQKIGWQYLLSPLGKGTIDHLS